MKRIILILLMTLLPLQSVWALGFCQFTSDNAMQLTDQSEATPSKAADPEKNSHSKVDFGCSPACQSACNVSALALPHTFDSLFLPHHAAATTMSNAAAYQSPIPDGPIRPKWLAAS